MLLPDETWAAIKPLFVAAFPNEAVVAVFADGSFKQYENVHPEPQRTFAISDADRAELMEREPALFLHTHPNGPAHPSDRDTEQQIATGWTWGISVVTGNAAGEVLDVSYPEIWGPAAPVLPLEGRTYCWGVRDCWTLVTDYMRAQGRELPPIPRVRAPGAHHTDPAKVNQFTHWAERLGFERVPDRAQRRPGDVAMLQWASPVPNHVAVFLGESRYLHQPDKSLSSVWQVTQEERMLERMAVTFWRLP